VCAVVETTVKPIDRLLQDLRERGDLPSPPQIVARLNEIANGPAISAPNLASIILRDRLLTSRVLEIANSVFRSGARDERITTVTQAVAFLGLRNAVQLTLGVSIFNMLVSSARDHLQMRIWIHSVGSAVAAQGLARAARLASPEEAFAAALIHDVGKLILLRHSSATYRPVLDRIESGENPLLAEREELGFTHADVGEAVAKLWNLPEALIRAIGGHHQFAESGDELQNVVTLANHIATLYYSVHRSPVSQTLREIERMAQDHLGLDKSDLADLLASLRSGVDECLGIFGLAETTKPPRAAEKTGPDRPLPEGERLQDAFAEMKLDIQRLNAQIGLLQRFSMGLVRESLGPDLTSMVLEGLYSCLGLERLALAVFTDDHLEGHAGFGPDVHAMLSLLTVDFTATPAHPLQGVVQTGRPLNVRDNAPATDAELSDWPWPSRAYAAVAVLHRGQPAGIMIADRGDTALAEEDLETLELFANQLSLALERGG
jgi:HD-like signal output (HDOD) protein